MNIRLSPEQVGLLLDLLPKVHRNLNDKGQQVKEAIRRGILDPDKDHVGVFLSWPLYVSGLTDDLAALEDIILKLNDAAAEGGTP